MFDEPENGMIRLVGVNDLPENAMVQYRVLKVCDVDLSDVVPKGISNEVVLSGKTVIDGDGTATIDRLPVSEGEKVFYLIEWEYNGRTYKNNYVTNIIDIDYRKYMNALKACDMDDFEGFTSET